MTTIPVSRPAMTGKSAYMLGIRLSRPDHEIVLYNVGISKIRKHRWAEVWCSCGRAHRVNANPHDLPLADLVRTAWIDHPCMHSEKP